MVECPCCHKPTIPAHAVLRAATYSEIPCPRCRCTLLVAPSWAELFAIIAILIYFALLFLFERPGELLAWISVLGLIAIAIAFLRVRLARLECEGDEEIV